MSILSDFLTENDLTAEQVVDRSAALEKLSQADRDLRVARETARREKKSYEDAGVEKPKALGRGVTIRTVKLALDGQPITRTNRKKIVRAVSSLLVSQKKDAVEWRVLFNDVGPRKALIRALGVRCPVILMDEYNTSKRCCDCQVR